MASMLLLLNSPSYWSPTVAPALRSRPALVSRSAPAAVSMAFALPGFGGKKQAGPSEEARRTGGKARIAPAPPVPGPQFPVAGTPVTGAPGQLPPVKAPGPGKS